MRAGTSSGGDPGGDRPAGAHRGEYRGEHRVDHLVDHLFRRQAGRLVAALTRRLGPAHLALAEEVVQEALIGALRRWPFSGVPDDPAAWLLTVARNRAYDRLRRERRMTSLEGRDGAEEEGGRGLLDDLAAAPADAPAAFADEITDDQLRAVFLCCHPALSADSRVALTLKLVLGFGVDEIARGLLVRREAVARRLSRAQATLRGLTGGESGPPSVHPAFEVPAGADLEPRLDGVLEVLYLLFNEGYSAHGGDRLIRQDLCAEAIRLAEALLRTPRTARPEVHALLSLFLFQAARLPARLDGAGELVLLLDQDRSRWDRRLLSRAFRHLGASASGHRLTEYHLQAEIAACHGATFGRATSENPAPEPDWERIAHLYRSLWERSPTPVVALNRAVAVAHRAPPEGGPEAALALLAPLGAPGEPLERSHLYHAVRGHLLARLGRREEAGAAYRRALDCPATEPERRFLRRRLARLSEEGNGAPEAALSCSRAPNMRA